MSDEPTFETAKDNKIEKAPEGGETEGQPTHSKTPIDDTKRESYQRFTDDNSRLLSLENEKDRAKVLSFLGEEGLFVNAKLKKSGQALSVEALEDAGEIEREVEKKLTFLQWIMQFIAALFGMGTGKGEIEKISERLPAMEFMLDSSQMRAIESGQDVKLKLTSGAEICLNKGIMTGKAVDTGEGIYKCRFGAVCIKEEGSNLYNVLDVAALGREFRDEEKGAAFKALLQKEREEKEKQKVEEEAEKIKKEETEKAKSEALSARNATSVASSEKPLSTSPSSNPVSSAQRTTLSSKSSELKEDEVQIRLTKKGRGSLLNFKNNLFQVLQGGGVKVFSLKESDITFLAEDSTRSDSIIATINRIEDSDGKVYKGEELRKLNLDGVEFHSVPSSPDKSLEFFLHSSYVQELKKGNDAKYTLENGDTYVLKKTDITKMTIVEDGNALILFNGFSIINGKGEESRFEGNTLSVPFFPDPENGKGLEKINDRVEKKMAEGQEKIALKRYQKEVEESIDKVRQHLKNVINSLSTQPDIRGEALRQNLAANAITPVVTVKHVDGQSYSFYAQEKNSKNLYNTEDLRDFSILVKMIESGTVSLEDTKISFRHTPLVHMSTEEEKKLWENVVKQNPFLDTPYSKALYIPKIETLSDAIPDFKSPQAPASFVNDLDVQLSSGGLRNPPPIDMNSNSQTQDLKKELLCSLIAKPAGVYDKDSSEYNPSKSERAMKGISEMLGMPENFVRTILNEGQLTITEETKDGFRPVDLNQVYDETADKAYLIVPSNGFNANHSVAFTTKGMKEEQTVIEQLLKDIPKKESQFSSSEVQASIIQYLSDINPQGIPDAADRVIVERKIQEGCLNGTFPVARQGSVPTSQELVDSIQYYMNQYEKRPETLVEKIEARVSADNLERSFDTKTKTEKIESQKNKQENQIKESATKKIMGMNK